MGRLSLKERVESLLYDAQLYEGQGWCSSDDGLAMVIEIVKILHEQMEEERMSVVITAQIEDLIEERAELLKKARGLSKAIESLQALCNHEYEDVGYDSHKTHYKCKSCLKEDSW